MAVRVRPVVLLAVAVVIAASIRMSTPIRAESAVHFYFGDIWTDNADVQLIEPGGTDLNFQNVGWQGDSFDNPLYLGVRYLHWLERSPRWGVSGEFIHAKMYADLNDRVQVTGTSMGTPVSVRAPVSGTFQQLQFSHGYNLLLASGQYRWLPGNKSELEAGHIQFRLGLGIGAALPHVEVVTASSGTDEYQFTGPAAQFLAGADIGLSKHWGMLIEYKLTYSDIDADLTGGGRLEVAALSNHLVFGATFEFGGAGPDAATPSP